MVIKKKVQGAKTTGADAAVAVKKSAKKKAAPTGATGEARNDTLGYNPGQPLEDSTVLESGRYKLKLSDMGKKGLKGWKISKPGNYPNRMITLTTERDGEEIKLREFITGNPEAFYRIHSLLEASQYPESFEIRKPKSPKDTKAVKAYIAKVDELLAWLMENDVELWAQVEPEDYQGRAQNRVKRYLPADEAEEGDEDELEDDDLDLDEDDEESDEDSDEEGEDEDSDEEADGEDEDDADEDEDESEDADGEESDEDADDEEESEEEEEEDSEDDEEEEVEEEPAPKKPSKKPAAKPSKIEPGPKVKQGPIGKTGKKPAKK